MPTNENPKSPHLPEVAGAVETITGSLVVAHGLRNIQTWGANLAEIQTADHVTVSAELSADRNSLNLRVMKVDGTTPSVVAAQVVWFAIGK